MVARSGAQVSMLRGTAGLNNTLDPERLSWGNKDNPYIVEMAIAKDISVDDRGLISLRKGTVLVQDGDFHSGFCQDSENAYVAKDGDSSTTLHRVTVSGTTVTVSPAVVSGMALGQRVSCVQANDLTLWANGSQCGIIQNGVNSAWAVDAYNGPDQNVSFLSSVPVGNHLGYDNAGTVAIARSNTIFFNYIAFVFGLFAAGRGFVQFPTQIRMVKSVESGWFVSDQKKTYFERGINWSDINESVVADFPAHEWSCAHELLEASEIGLDLPGYCAFWSSPQGLIAGLPNGQVVNLTSQRIKYPSAYERAACLVYDRRKLINTVY